MLAYAREDQKLDINLEKESDKDAVSLLLQPRVKCSILIGIVSFSCTSTRVCLVLLIQMVLRSRRSKSSLHSKRSTELQDVLMMVSRIRIDEKYLDDSNSQKAFRLETYRSSGNPSKGLAHREYRLLGEQV